MIWVINVDHDNLTHVTKLKDFFYISGKWNLDKSNYSRYQ